jgi:hypothetical protein
LERAAEQLADAGLVDEAIAFYLHAAEGRRIRAFKHPTGLLESNDRTDEASQLERLGIAPDGHPADSWDLTELQRPRSRPLR